MPVRLRAGVSNQVTAWVARDRLMLELPLNLSPLAAKTACEDADSAKAISNLGLEISDKTAAERWLTGVSE